MDNSFDADFNGSRNARAAADYAQILLGRARHASADGRETPNSKRGRTASTRQTNRTKSKKSLGNAQQQLFRQSQKIVKKTLTFIIFPIKIMNKGRLEAFSDGVIAILITIMVLELKVPHGADLDALRPLAPVFSAYVLSFIYLGIYWNNHHHLLQATKHINGAILWANLHLLFWLSLVAVHYKLDGRKSFRGSADRCLRRCFVRGGDGLLYSANFNSQGTRRKFHDQNRARQGFEGKKFALYIHCGDYFSIFQSIRCRRALCFRRADVARAGQKN